MKLATLGEAIEWASSRWEGRATPMKLHDPTQTEGALGGLPFTPAFQRHLDAHPAQVTQEERTVSCYHPTLPPKQDPKLCRECFGTGAKSSRRLVYRYPMWRALNKLQNALPIRRSYPHPHAGVLVLARHGWDARDAASALSLPWDFAEAYFLQALRMLHGRYEEGPVETRSMASPTVGWLDMSDSQRAAIEAGETAA